MSDCRVLLVTCCLEQSRHDILQQVVDNLEEQDPELFQLIDVIDNASTIPATLSLLRRFKHAYRIDKNVGYWTAIDWWLQSLSSDPPRYTYIIESDMIHYDLKRFADCIKFLDDHPELGAMRLHEYSVEDRHMYDKDYPVTQSKREVWRSHTNAVTGKRVNIDHVDGSFYRSTFLTHLPALNRYPTMKACFDSLRGAGMFSEQNFQHLYYKHHPEIAILDGGMFHDRLGSFRAKTLTGSWSRPEALKEVGYQGTRLTSILPLDQYTVTSLP